MPWFSHTSRTRYKPPENSNTAPNPHPERSRTPENTHSTQTPLSPGLAEVTREAIRSVRSDQNRRALFERPPLAERPKTPVQKTPTDIQKLLDTVFKNLQDDFPVEEELGKLLATENGIIALKGLKAKDGREMHGMLMAALGNIGGAAALDVLGSHIIGGQFSWEPAADAAKNLLHSKDHQNLENTREVASVIEKLSGFLPALTATAQPELDFNRFRKMLDLVVELGKLHDDPDIKEEIAEALYICIKNGDKAREFDVCNRSFLGLMKSDGDLANKHLLSIPPHQEWLKGFSQRLPGTIFGRYYKNGDNQAKGSIDELLLDHLATASPRNHLEMLLASNVPQILYELSPEETSSFAKALFDQPKKFESALSKLSQLSSVSLRIARGNSLDVSRNLLTAAKIKPETTASSPLGEELHARLEGAKKAHPVDHPNLFSELKSKGWKLHQNLGRTLVFQRNGKFRAVKIQKKGEPVGELLRQKEMVDFFNENRKELGLRSEVPTAIEVCKINDLDSFLKTQGVDAADAFKGLIEQHKEGNGTSVNAYVYECASSDYFTYLHQADNPESFGQAAAKSLHDSIATWKKAGHVFTRLADIFHTPVGLAEGRSDAGRYRALLFKGISCGDIRDWQRAVEYINMRSSGLADEGDCDRADDLFSKNGALAQQYFSDMFADFGEAAPAMLMANHIAENLLAVELAAGKCALSLSKGMPKARQDEIWEKMGGEMRALYGQVFAECGEVPVDKALRFLDKAVNWEAYARQMQFWMTDEYIKALHDNKEIPSDVYGPSVTTSVEPDLLPDSFQEHGFKHDLKSGPNLGARSGICPLLEAVKARAITATFALLLSQEKQESIDS